MPTDYEPPKAVELTPAQQQEASDIAFGLQDSIRAAVRKGREALWELAEACYLFHQEQGWLALGHDSIGQWLAQEPEMSQATYSRLISTWGKLHVQKGIPEARLRDLDVTKAHVVLPKLMANEVTVEKALADVEVLGYRDLREEYGVARPRGEDTDKTPPVDSGRVFEESVHEVHVLDPEPDPEEDEEAFEAVVEAIEIAAEPSVAEQHRAALGNDEEYGIVALNAASELPWGVLINAYNSGFTSPRVDREVVKAFLGWREQYNV